MPWRNDATPRNTIKPNSSKSANLDGKSGVLQDAHMGGHSDVAAMQTKLAAQGLKPQSPAELKKIMQNDLNNTVQKNAPSMQQFQAQMSKKYLDKK